MLAGTALAALLWGGAAWADVKAGVEAWSRGDYAAAVHEWEGPAAAGDADAMFNLGQAYRLGRGVPPDPAKAEALYARAAAKGHLRAADTYGLLLFQDGRREAAVPYLQDAARRGDPRAEYLLGIAHFNGDVVPKDWVRAYALLSMANAQGLPQAAAAIAQMDQQIPLAQRQQAAGLAVQLQNQAEQARGRALAATDLDAGAAGPVSAPSSPTPPSAKARVSPPTATAAVSPSIAAAQQAVAEARQATGTASPAEAGASFARRSPAPSRVAVAAAPKAVAKPVPAASPPAARPAAARPSACPCKIQLGAFSVRGNADKLWARVSGRSELAGKAKLTVPAGGLTKLMAAGYPSRDAAEDACRSLKRGGQDCLVTR
jgi:hypothetical protein